MCATTIMLTHQEECQYRRRRNKWWPEGNRSSLQIGLRSRAQLVVIADESTFAVPEAGGAVASLSCAYAR
jgi:hypothetical protein